MKTLASLKVQKHSLRLPVQAGSKYKNIFVFAFSCFSAFMLFVIPVHAAQIDTLVRAVNKFVINPLIILIFAVALAYFLFGVVGFLVKADNEEARTKGKKHMLWGIVGMFIMIAVFAIMQILITSLGVEGVDIQTGKVNLD